MDIGMQLLRFGIFYRLKAERRKASGLAKEFYDNVLIQLGVKNGTIV